MRQRTVFLALWVFVCFAVQSFSGSSIAHARTTHGTPGQCDAAAANASAISGVPVDVLLAISRVETGRTIGGVLSPWPWTVNKAGAGAFFDTMEKAVDHVLLAMADGQRNIDIGCFQINIRWHGAEFPSLEAMFDPTKNALYAARFLTRLYDEFGTWDGAIGAYHSRQSAAATRYLAKVSALMTDPPPSLLSGGGLSTAGRDNRYPLLRPGKAGDNGSLVASTLDHPAIPLFR